MVRLAGIEPARLSARDFKSLMSTYFTTVAKILTVLKNIAELSAYVHIIYDRPFVVKCFVQVFST
jgi:hypothetical protein